MNEVKTVKIYSLITALTPVKHMMGTHGNEAVLNRESVFHDGMVSQIPVLSGNALRHVLIREAGAMHLIDACGLHGKLNIEQANFLLYGGSLTKSSTANNLKKIADMQQLLPLYRLLGGDLQDQILGGSLLCGRGILACKENEDVLARILPEGLLYSDAWLRNAEDFISSDQYTRGDVTSDLDVLTEEEMEATKEDSSRMIYSGQSLIPGTMFCQEIVMQGVSKLEVGALFTALSRWDADGGIIGGSKRIGHGRVKLEYYVHNAHDFFGESLDVPALMAEYDQYTRDNADNIAAWLQETFPSTVREKKEAKAKRETERSKGKKANPVPDAFEALIELASEGER